MDATEALKKQRQMIQELKALLIRCGIPESAIVTEAFLRNNRTGKRYDADVLLLSNDRKAIVAQFEVKLWQRAFVDACKAVMDLSKHHLCYVVAKNAEDESFVAVAKDARNPNWMKLTAESIKELLGNYEVKSDIAISTTNSGRQKVISQKFDTLRWRVSGIGGFLVLLLGILECCSVVFSPQFYSLLLVVLGLIAAATGYEVHVELADVCEFSFGVQQK